MPKWYELQEFGSHPLHHLRAYPRRDSQSQLRYNTTHHNTPTTCHNTNYLKQNPSQSKTCWQREGWGDSIAHLRSKRSRRAWTIFLKGSDGLIKDPSSSNPQLVTSEKRRKRKKTKSPKSENLLSMQCVSSIIFILYFIYFCTIPFMVLFSNPFWFIFSDRRTTFGYR